MTATFDRPSSETREARPCFALQASVSAAGLILSRGPGKCKVVRVAQRRIGPLVSEVARFALHDARLSRVAPRDVQK